MIIVFGIVLCGAVAILSVLLYFEHARRCAALLAPHPVTPPVAPSPPAPEMQLRRTQQLESLGMLAGEIAHDFNNILTAIIGHTSLALVELPEDSPARASLEEVEVEARRAADLCRQMLVYSSKGHPAMQEVDLNALISEMHHLLHISMSKKTRLEFSLSPAMPKVLASPTQMRQVVLNLVINASESLGGKDGVVTVRTRPGQRGKRVAFLEVSDTGCGMDDYTRANLFEPFFSTKSDGRGLGMAAVQGIVEAHRGRIEVLTRPGIGTTFHIELPVSRTTVTVSPRKRKREAEEAQERPWQGVGTVLLVEDEKTVRLASRRMLEQMGYTVEIACDGEEALEAFQSAPEKYTFVMMDLVMPRMNGDETCREMRRIRADLPILLASGYGEDEVEKRLSRGEFTEFLQKPYDSATLSETLWRTFGSAN